jgi:hypothetical protein
VESCEVWEKVREESCRMQSWDADADADVDADVDADADAIRSRDATR